MKNIYELKHFMTINSSNFKLSAVFYSLISIRWYSLRFCRTLIIIIIVKYHVGIRDQIVGIAWLILQWSKLPTNHIPFLFVRNKLVGRIAAFTGSPHHLSNFSSEGNSAAISKANSRPITFNLTFLVCKVHLVTKLSHDAMFAKWAQ